MALVCGCAREGSTKAASSGQASSTNDGIALSHEQLQALVVGLPWERLDERTKIRVL